MSWIFCAFVLLIELLTSTPEGTVPLSSVLAGEGGVEGSAAVVNAVIKFLFRWTASYSARRKESFALK